MHTSKNKLFCLTLLTLAFLFFSSCSSTPPQNTASAPFTPHSFYLELKKHGQKFETRSDLKELFIHYFDQNIQREMRAQSQILNRFPSLALEKEIPIPYELIQLDLSLRRKFRDLGRRELYQVSCLDTYLESYFSELAKDQNSKNIAAKSRDDWQEDCHMLAHMHFYNLSERGRYISAQMWSLPVVQNSLRRLRDIWDQESEEGFRQRLMELYR